MKKILLSMFALTLLAACKKEVSVETNVTETDTTKVATTEEAPPPAMDSVAMMEAWMKYATPGETHKLLAEDVGNWEAEMLMWEPDKPDPTKTTLKATCRMILDGRYQETRFTGNMMGQPFEGVSTVGYNNASGKIESVWMDNMGTGAGVATGSWDEATKTIKLAGESADPFNNGKPKKFREEFVIVDANTRKMTMHENLPNGSEYKVMEMTMKRK